MPEATLSKLFSSVNGILFTGGDNTLLPDTQYYKTAKTLYDWAKEANDKGGDRCSFLLIILGDFFPLWGTCQGFQLLSILAAQDQSVLLHNYYDSYNYSIPIVLTPHAASSRLFNALSPSTVKTLTTQNVTENLHHNGVLPETYTTNANLAKIFNLLSVNTDRKGTPFGSTMEGQEYPFYATQWHPERNQFDWGLDEGLNKTPEAISAMQDLANFFVSETRKNYHHFPTAAAEQANLIYQWSPTYTGDDGEYPEEETYYFPLWSEEEKI